PSPWDGIRNSLRKPRSGSPSSCVRVHSGSARKSGECDMGGREPLAAITAAVVKSQGMDAVLLLLRRGGFPTGVIDTLRGDYRRTAEAIFPPRSRSTGIPH